MLIAEVIVPGRREKEAISPNVDSGHHGNSEYVSTKLAQDRTAFRGGNDKNDVLEEHVALRSATKSLQVCRWNNSGEGR